MSLRLPVGEDGLQVGAAVVLALDQDRLVADRALLVVDRGRRRRASPPGATAGSRRRGRGRPPGRIPRRRPSAPSARASRAGSNCCERPRTPIPDGPAPTPVLSSTMTSRPNPPSGLELLRQVPRGRQAVDAGTDHDVLRCVIGSERQAGYSSRRTGRRRTASRAARPSSSTACRPGRSRPRARRRGRQTLQPGDLGVGILDPQIEVHRGLARRDDVHPLDEQSRSWVAFGGSERRVGPALKQTLVAERLLPEPRRGIGVDGVHHDLDRRGHARSAAPSARAASATNACQIPSMRASSCHSSWSSHWTPSTNAARRASRRPRPRRGGPERRREPLTELARSPGGGSCRRRTLAEVRREHRA